MMKIGMVFFDMQEFGGLEEYATALAVNLQQRGHQVSMFSAAWVPPENQYLRRLKNHGIPLVQLPQWISHPASDWQTKERILTIVVTLLTPLVYGLGLGVFLVKRCSWHQALTSARHWLRGQLMNRIIGPDRRKPLARLLLDWWRLCWQPDLLHIHGYTTSLLFVIDWAYSRKIPIVYEEHQTPDPQFDWWNGFDQSINKANVVVAVSDKSAQSLRDLCGVKRPIIVQGPLVAGPSEDGWKQGNRLSTNGQLRVTTVARLYVTKGLKYLLEAIAQIRRTHPEAQFKVYGEGSLRQELVEYANQLGLDGDAIFVGAFTHREELARIMAQTDIFVISSILEGQPLSLVEAMAYGCPIVATAVGGIPEIIQDGVNGLLCPPGDSNALARKICTLIEDTDLRARLGHAARTSYEQGPFQPNAVCNQFISIYEQCLKSRGESMLGT